MKKKISKPNSEDITREFNKRKPNYASLREEAVHTLEKRLRESDIKIHSMPSRVKDLDSFLDKIERKQYENPFEQIQDFVGIRIICLFLSDIPKIGKIIRKTFEVIESEDKIDGGDSSSFGYMSVHHIVKFGDNVKGDRYDDVKNIPFEIQVRTIAMDSWANVSHYLEYKNEKDIPDELKRDFNALSGMFYVADKHFQLFFEQRHKKQEEIAKTFEKGEEIDKNRQPINLDTLAAFMRDKFPDREASDTNSVSELTEELTTVGYRTIGEIENLVNNAWLAFLSYEKEHPPFAEPGRKFSDVGVIRGISKITNDVFLDLFGQSNKEIYKKYRHLLNNEN